MRPSAALGFNMNFTDFLMLVLCGISGALIYETKRSKFVNSKIENLITGLVFAVSLVYLVVRIFVCL